MTYDHVEDCYECFEGVKHTPAEHRLNVANYRAQANQRREFWEKSRCKQCGNIGHRAEYCPGLLPF